MKNKSPLILTLFLFLAMLFLLSPASASETKSFPTKDKPLIIDEKEKKVMIYTEVHGKNLQQFNSHWALSLKMASFMIRRYLNLM